MIKILVVEDEMIIAADISMQLEMLGYEVQGILSRGEDALQSLASTLPDMVLMDISLKGKLDGIETAQAIYDNYKIPLVFLTSNSDNATFQRAKVTKPYAFISKPFSQTELQRVIELVIEQIKEETQSVKKPQDEETLILKDRIFLKHKDKMLKIFLKDILFAEADRSYCKIYTKTQDYLLTMPLGRLEEKLESKDFLRIHRSHIINLTQLDTISEYYTHVTLANKVLPVSRRFQEVLAQRLKVI